MSVVGAGASSLKVCYGVLFALSPEITRTSTIVMKTANERHTKSIRPGITKNGRMGIGALIEVSPHCMKELIAVVVVRLLASNGNTV
jgi:hypothetical protein